jgi:hypothetical protein
MGSLEADERRGGSHERPGGGPRKPREARRKDRPARGLRAALQAGHPARDRGGEGQQLAVR